MPLIWGEMGRGIFSLEALDRANHVELFQQIMVFEHRAVTGCRPRIGCFMGQIEAMPIAEPNG
jgi:DNA polymerase III delta prime subunit